MVDMEIEEILSTICLMCLVKFDGMNALVKKSVSGSLDGGDRRKRSCLERLLVEEMKEKGFQGQKGLGISLRYQISCYQFAYPFGQT